MTPLKWLNTMYKIHGSFELSVALRILLTIPVAADSTAWTLKKIEYKKLSDSSEFREVAQAGILSVENKWKSGLRQYASQFCWNVGEGKDI